MRLRSCRDWRCDKIGKMKRDPAACTRASNLNSNFVVVESADCLDRRAWGLVVAQISLAASGNGHAEICGTTLTSVDKLATATATNLLAASYPLPQYFRYAEFAPLDAADQPAHPQNSSN